MLDTVSDAAGLRAVCAKVHAEASTVCPSCGRRHLLDNRCSAAPAVVLDEEALPDESPVRAPAPDTAVERAATSARRLLGSVIAYLGLDPASFGEVDADTRGRAVPPPSVRSHPLRVQRVIAFLGFEVAAAPGVEATENDDDDVVVTPDVAPTSSPAEEVLAPDDDAPPAESVGVDLDVDVNVDVDVEIDVDVDVGTDADVDMDMDVDVGTDVDVDVDLSEPAMRPDDAARRYWRRTDDDILYRPSRRPRSPRRVWRDRTASRD